MCSDGINFMYGKLTMIFLAVFTILCVTSVSNGWVIKQNKKYVYPTKYHYKQLLDHFNPTIDATFKERYFVSDQYWDKKNGPIFFYTGNEGDITSFINNTGFIWDIAPIFQALVVFAEHRYYGRSQPYGNISPSKNTTKEFAQLTAEQALADYAELITFIKKDRNADKCAVIAFGGSYGGMLSAWLRIKYGHIVDGAIAASSPVNNFVNHIDCDSYNKVVTNDFLSTQHGNQCVKNIQNGWFLINSTAQQSGGLSKLSKVFRLCKQLDSGEELINWMVECWGNIAMVDYPYPADFLSPLPAWPINVTCKYLSQPLDGMDLLEGLFNAISVYANHSGSVACFDTKVVQSAAISNSLWNYQTCTEMVMPFCATGTTDMFPTSKWNYNSFSQNCKERFGVMPRPDWIETNFGGINLSSASNIVFSNGLLDPWHPGGVLHNISDSVVAILMWGAAHHLDLRHMEIEDPASVLKCREIEMSHITKWIVEKYVQEFGAFN